MAHKLLAEEVLGKRLSKFKLPTVNGRFGISVYVGTKEVFLGVQINPVIEETIIKKRSLVTLKSKVSVFNFDPNS